MTYHGIFHDINERDDVGASPKVLQDFDLPLDFLFLHRLWRTIRAFSCEGHQLHPRSTGFLEYSPYLEDLHHHLLVVGDVDRLKDLAVLSPAQLPHQLKVILIPEASKATLKWK